MAAILSTNLDTYKDIVERTCGCAGTQAELTGQLALWLRRSPDQEAVSSNPLRGRELDAKALDLMFSIVN